VLDYQENFPRTLSYISESSSFLENIVFYFFPTFNYLYLGIIKSASAWGAWEKTIFSPITYIFLYLVLFKRKGFRKGTDRNSIIKQFGISLILVGFLLSLGDFTSLAPFSILKYLSNNSIRVPFRFSLACLFGIYILVCYNNNYLKLKRFTLSLTLALICLNSLSFYQQHFFVKPNNTQFQGVLSNYKNLTFVPKRNNIASSMYMASQVGIGVFNCYMPMTRDMQVSGEFNFPKKYILRPFHFIQNESKLCLEKSYFTQENLYISNNCKKELCINLNAINIYNKSTLGTFKINKKGNGFCRD
jgi:hypothetical protein